MSRPELAVFDAIDIAGRVWEAKLLGPESETPCCGVVLPETVVSVMIPMDLADPFARSREVQFDVSDTPLVSLVTMMAGARGSVPADHDDAGRRGD